MSDWLAEVVVVNENRDASLAGDVSLFRNAGEACSYLEHWWVNAAEGFAFTVGGDRLMLGVNAKNRVVVMSQSHTPGDTELVLGWLRAYAGAVLLARAAKAKRGRATLNGLEEEGQLPTSVEGLIGYIGFWH